MDELLRAYRFPCGKSLVLIALTVLLMGCQTVPLGSVSGVVSQEHWIPLAPSGKDTGQWETRDLRVDYTMARTGSQLHLSGVVRLSDLITYSHSRIEYFHLDALLLDAQGNVLAMRGLTSSMYTNPDAPFPLESTLMLPGGTEALAFSYRGQARGSDQDSGSATYFWHYPIR